MGKDRDDSPLKDMNNKDLIKYIERFQGSPILVVGDIIGDHYIWGTVERISPEAPVPVVDVERESYMLGGAGNVANNIVSLGGKVKICGVVGNDEMGQWIVHNLKRGGIETEGIVVEEERPTTKKTRVIAHSQHVVRFDYENKNDITQSSQDRIIHYIQTHLHEVRTIVLSDYAKGVITRYVVKKILEMAQKENLYVVVDPKTQHFDYYAGSTVITPNTHEAAIAAGIPIKDMESLLKAGHILLSQSSAKAILITRGEHGMSLFERDKSPFHIPAVAREVFDVTGAGDTVVGTLALSISTGASLKEGAMIANYAAGLVVGMVGTGTVSREALRNAIKHHKGRD